MGLQVEFESAGLGWAWPGGWASSCGSSWPWLLSANWAQGWALCVHVGAQAEGENLTGQAHLRVRVEVPEGKPNLASRSQGPACIIPTNILLAKTRHVACQLSIY